MIGIYCHAEGNRCIFTCTKSVSAWGKHTHTPHWKDNTFLLQTVQFHLKPWKPRTRLYSPPVQVIGMHNLWLPQSYHKERAASQPAYPRVLNGKQFTSRCNRFSENQEDPAFMICMLLRLCNWAIGWKGCIQKNSSVCRWLYKLKTILYKLFVSRI